MPYSQKPVVLDRGDYTTATINVYGGNITSWRIKNKEMLYMPKTAEFDGLKPTYGGLKITFPYFGYSNHGPRHGFSRCTPYIIEEPPKKKENGDIEAIFSLNNNEFTESIANIKFKLTLKITLGTDNLNIAITVKNTCQYFPLNFALLRHCMVRVKDLNKCKIVGLKEMGYTKLGQPSPQLRDWDDYFQCVDITEPRIYENISDEVVLINISETKKMIFTHSSPMELLTYNPYKDRNGRAYTIKCSGNGKNPEPKVDQSDVTDPCYAIGMGEVGQPMRLEPNTEWSFSGDIIVEDEDEERRKRRIQHLNLFDYVSRYC